MSMENYKRESRFPPRTSGALIDTGEPWFRRWTCVQVGATNSFLGLVVAQEVQYGASDLLGDTRFHFDGHFARNSPVNPSRHARSIVDFDACTICVEQPAYAFSENTLAIVVVLPHAPLRAPLCL